MKQLDTAFLSHIQQEVTTLAWCWKITRTDGVVIAFTNFDQDLEIDGLTYQAATGFSPSAIASSNTMAVDNLELSSIFSQQVTETELIGGKFDDARVQVFQVNYLDLPVSLSSTPPKYLLSVSGLLGEISNSDSVFAAEVRSLTQFLAQKQIQLTSKQCRYEFGVDPRCGVDLTLHTFPNTVTGISTNREIFLANAISNGTAGKITFNSGANAGLSQKIAFADSYKVILFEPMPFVITALDDVTIVSGCVKTRPACMGYNNVINFGGEPDVPGVDEYLKGAG